MRGLHSYKEEENVQRSRNITHVHTLTVFVQALWEADARTEIGVQAMSGEETSMKTRGEGAGTGVGVLQSGMQVWHLRKEREDEASGCSAAECGQARRQGAQHASASREALHWAGGPCSVALPCPVVQKRPRNSGELAGMPADPDCAAAEGVGSSGSSKAAFSSREIWAAHIHSCPTDAWRSATTSSRWVTRWAQRRRSWVPKPLFFTPSSLNFPLHHVSPKQMLLLPWNLLLVWPCCGAWRPSLILGRLSFPRRRPVQDARRETGPAKAVGTMISLFSAERWHASPLKIHHFLAWCYHKSWKLFQLEWTIQNHKTVTQTTQYCSV